MTDRGRRNLAIRSRAGTLLPVVATLALLGGVTVDRARRDLPTREEERYHAAVRAIAADEIPYNIGPWLGRDTEVPSGAVALLQPNVMVARLYRNISTGQQLTFLLVQCRDARHLLGHYPPVCYPAHGMRPRGAREVDWATEDGQVVTGMRYEYESTRADRDAAIVVDNFMVLPDGTISRDMDGVHRTAQDPARKLLGAAQVQVVTGKADLTDAERDEAVRAFVAACRRTITAIRTGAGT